MPVAGLRLLLYMIKLFYIFDAEAIKSVDSAISLVERYLLNEENQCSKKNNGKTDILAEYFISKATRRVIVNLTILANIEAGQLICRENQLTGFYLMATSVFTSFVFIMVILNRLLINAIT